MQRAKLASGPYRGNGGILSGYRLSGILLRDE